jgi:hypothetical protein
MRAAARLRGGARNAVQFDENSRFAEPATRQSADALLRSAGIGGLSSGVGFILAAG